MCFSVDYNLPICYNQISIAHPKQPNIINHCTLSQKQPDWLKGHKLIASQPLDSIWRLLLYRQGSKSDPGQMERFFVCVRNHISHSEAYARIAA